MLRRRWKLMTALVVAGTLLGTFAAARAAGDSDQVVERVYYSAEHELLVAPGQSGRISFSQAAHLFTGGSLPTDIAERLDVNRSEVIPRLLTVSNTTIGSFTISAVGETPEDAAELTDVAAAELIAYLLAEDQQEFDQVLAAAEDDAAAARARLDEVDREIDQLQPGLDELGEPIPLSTADRTELELVQAQRAGVVGTYNTALAEVARLRDNQPQPAFETFEISPPVPISESAFNQRLRAGRNGEASYSNFDDIPTGGSSPFSRENLADNPIVLIVGGFLAGLLLAIIAVATLTRLDHRILSRGEAQEYFGLPVIAEIPRYRRRDRKTTELVSFTEQMSHIAEAYRSLRASLMYSDVAGQSNGSDTEADGAQVVMVTSAGASEGKTTVTANLATVMAETGYSVLAVNCDYRRPKLAFHLGGDHTPLKVSQTVVDGVMLVNHTTEEGAASVPSEAVAAQRSLIDKARRRAGRDVIILDTAPLLATNDANELISSVDLVLVVAFLGRTTKEAAEKTRELLERRGAPVAGVVLVGTRDAVVSKRYYYYSSDVVRKSAAREQHGDDVPEEAEDTATEPADGELVLVGAGGGSGSSAELAQATEPLPSMLPMFALWEDDADDLDDTAANDTAADDTAADDTVADDTVVDDPALDETLFDDTAAGDHVVDDTLVDETTLDVIAPFPDTGARPRKRFRRLRLGRRTW